MKLKEGFITHDTDGEQIMVAVGKARFSGLVRSNRTAAFVVDCLRKETTRERIVDTMAAKYDVSRGILEQDVQKIIDQLRSIDAIDD